MLSVQKENGSCKLDSSFRQLLRVTAKHCNAGMLYIINAIFFCQ